MKMHPELTGAIPDSRGINLYRADGDAAALFAHYLPARPVRPSGATFRPARRAWPATGSTSSPASRTAIRRRSRCGGAPARTATASKSTRPMWRWSASRFPSSASRPLSHRGALGWPEPMPPAAKYALTYLFVQAEFGLLCPVNMTDSLTRTLKRYGDPALVARFIDRLTIARFRRRSRRAPCS